MNEYLAEKILKEYEIKCESNKKFPYLMLFNTVFACFFWFCHAFMYLIFYYQVR